MKKCLCVAFCYLMDVCVGLTCLNGPYLALGPMIYFHLVRWSSILSITGPGHRIGTQLSGSHLGWFPKRKDCVINVFLFKSDK